MSPAGCLSFIVRQDMRIGFLASHRGSNMQAVLDACEAGSLSATPVVLVTNNRGAEAIQRAQRAGMSIHVLNGVTHPDPDLLDLAIHDALTAARCDLIVLAGFMKMIGPRVLHAFARRIVNIHPALLPRHGGKGMFGMHVHRSVIASGDRISGVSVHLVDEEYDHGRVLAQAEVPVEPDDTPESLAERVLKKEHEFLPEVVSRIAKGELSLWR